MSRKAIGVPERLGLLLVAVCAGSTLFCKSAVGPVGPTQVTVSSVSVSGTSQVEAGATTQWVATAQYSNGTSQAVTNDATWESSSTTVATVARGVVSGVAAGQSTIKATYQGSSGQGQVTVVVVLDANPGGPYGPIEVGRTLQLSGLSSRASFGIREYRWDYGDGTTGTGATPTKVYAQALVPSGGQRTFTVTLTIVDNRGAVSSSKSTTVLVTRLY